MLWIIPRRVLHQDRNETLADAGLQGAQPMGWVFGRVKMGFSNIYVKQLWANS